MIILNWILEKLVARMLTRLSWFKSSFVLGIRKHGNEPSESFKREKFFDLLNNHQVLIENSVLKALIF